MNFQQTLEQNLQKAVMESLQEIRYRLLAEGVSKEIVDKCITSRESVNEYFGKYKHDHLEIVDNEAFQKGEMSKVLEDKPKVQKVKEEVKKVKENESRKPVIKKNKWGNYENDDGFVFFMMRITSKETGKIRKTKVVIGIQNLDVDPEEFPKLQSVDYFTDDEIEVCKENKWTWLTEDLLEDAIVNDKKVKSCEEEFRGILSRIDEDEKEEGGCVYASVSVKILHSKKDRSKRVRLIIAFDSSDVFKKYEDDLSSFNEDFDNWVDDEYGEEGWVFDDNSKARIGDLMNEKPDEEIAFRVTE